MAILLILFYLVAAILACLCIYIANSMTKETCSCIKHSMVLLIAGIGFLVCSIYYTTPIWHRIISIAIIFLGLIGWLFFDRYRAHQDFKLLKSFIIEQAYYIKEYLKELVGGR